MPGRLVTNQLMHCLQPPEHLPWVLCLLTQAPHFHTFFRCLDVLDHLLSSEGLLPPAADANNSADLAVLPPEPVSYTHLTLPTTPYV